MTSQQFKNAWRTTDQPLSVISSAKLTKFNLLPDTTLFLTETGLPIYASPFLSFEFVEDEKYLAIGLCRDGDLIIIHNNELQQLTSDGPLFFNTSINTLADFLIIYRDFEDAVMLTEGEEGVRNSYFTDAQFDTLKQRMLEADERALIEKGFWKDELELLLADRQDYLNTR
jgi:hypothetical protein